MAKSKSKRPMSKAALERQRAKAARERFLLEKKRSEAAKKAWETRRDPENLFDAMIRNVKKYRDTGHKRYYSLFRMSKRTLYQLMGAEAADIVHTACEEAGWSVSEAVRFAKLS